MQIMVRKNSYLRPISVALMVVMILLFLASVLMSARNSI